MSMPQTADPRAWAEYNAKLLGMTPEELARETVTIADVPSMATTVAILTPSGSLAAEVVRIASKMLASPYHDHGPARELLLAVGFTEPEALEGVTAEMFEGARCEF